MEQLVEVFLELEKHPLRATGSLTEDGIVGPFAQSHTFSTPSLSLGPFDTAEEALTCIIKHEIEMVESGELSTLAIDNYLTHIWRLEQIPEMLANARDGSFYIEHFDEKGDHILVDLETLEAGTGTALNSLSGMLTGWPSSNRICGDASAKSFATPTQREGDSGAAAREVNVCTTSTTSRAEEAGQLGRVSQMEMVRSAEDELFDGLDDLDFDESLNQE
jgi:hypothetical protein